MKRDSGGGCPFLAQPEDVTVDVSKLGPELEALVYEKLGLAPPGGMPESVHLAHSTFLGMIMPDKLDPAGFFGGLTAGVSLSAGLARVLDGLTGLSPLIVTSSSTALALIAHLIAKSSGTLGFLAGTAPLLIEQGIVALVDLMMPEESVAPAGGAGVMPGTTQEVAMHGANHPSLGQFTRRSMEEIERVLKILEPTGGRGGGGPMLGPSGARSSNGGNGSSDIASSSSMGGSSLAAA